MPILNNPKYKRVFTGILVAASLVGGLWIFWFVGATRYQNAIDDWIKIGRSEGYEISYDQREQFGFPRRTVLRFTNVHWKNTDGIEFRAGDLDISADFWETRKFKVTFKGQVELVAPSDSSRYSLILGGESGTATIELSENGVWQNCGIDMNAARLGRAPDYVFLIDTINISSHRPAKDPTSIKEAGLTLAAEIDDVTLPPAMPPSFGPHMAKFQIDLRLMGPIPDFRKKDSAVAWNKINGMVEFDQLNVAWGPLLLNSKGTMNFDDDLQPEGVFAATVGHPDDVIAKLVKGGYIASAQQDLFASAMRFMAKPTPIDGAKGIEVPIAVQLGGFFLGPIKVFSFPPIDWD